MAGTDKILDELELYSEPVALLVLAYKLLAYFGKPLLLDIILEASPRKHWACTEKPAMFLATAEVEHAFERQDNTSFYTTV